MPKREHLMCLAAFSALVAFSPVSRADDNYVPNTDRFARLEGESKPMTCAQATAHAWFLRQLELGEGGPHDAPLPTPPECERTNVATGPAGDREVNEDK